MGPAHDQLRTRARRSSPPAPAAAGGAAAAWSPPAFTRPSNLRAFVRTGASFPPTHAPQYQQHHQEPRSQRTQATQTHEQLQSVDDDARDVNLGAFGRVGDLPLDTVDFLLRVLEDRKHELLMASARAPVVERQAPLSRADDQRRDGWRRGCCSSSSSRAVAAKPRVVDDEHTESSDTSDEPAAATADTTTHQRASASMALAPAAIVRSRSYEALVQLEGILEARHQQLMSDGLLEPVTASSSSASVVAGDAPVSRRSAAGEGDRYRYDGERGEDGVETTDIQEEIRKMHRSLRRQRAEQSVNALDGELESLFVRGSS